MTVGPHVVIGTGPAGRAVAAALLAKGDWFPTHTKSNGLSEATTTKVTS